MSKIFKPGAHANREDNSAHEEESESDDCDSDCPLQPEFKDGDDKVQLTRDKYVQLLIEARETDPGCWPPGLEDAAHLLERARDIEEHCTTKYGHFEPERLSKKMRDEYLQIHLTLDELQNGLEQGTEQIEDEEENLTTIPTPRGAWTEINAHARPDNFA